MSEWQPVIGLEVHVQLATRSKLFSGAPTTFGADPNSQACAIDLALPGTLPVVNGEAIRMAVQFGLVVDAQIASCSVFARKHYFYPDLPRGYQISQYADPIVSGGCIHFRLGDGSARTVRLERAHLEEDAGKSVHDKFAGCTAVDLNRAGVPLLEIVTRPEMHTAEEAVACLQSVHALVSALGICDGEMSQGSLRCDVNVSLRPVGSQTLGERTEIKNLNSFRFVEKAIIEEIERQRALLDGGKTIERMTMLYDESNQSTRPMRSKEQENDYRYFPDPDLLPVVVTAEMLEQWRQSLPELPDARRQRLSEHYDLTEEEIAQLAGEPRLSAYFEELVACCGHVRQAVNWIQGELAAHLNSSGLAIEASPVTAVRLGTLILRLEQGQISSKIAKQIFAALSRGEGEVDEIIARDNLQQLDNPDAIRELVQAVVRDHPKQLEQYRLATPDKRKRMRGFFVGQVMKRCGGRANPGQLDAALGACLDEPSG